MAQKSEIMIAMVKNEMDCLNHATSGFKITRIVNGITVDIELTYNELSQAFCCREHMYYVTDVEKVLEEFERDGKLFGHSAAEIRTNDDLMEKIVSTYAENREDYEMEWHYAAENAIKVNMST